MTCSLQHKIQFKGRVTQNSDNNITHKNIWIFYWFAKMSFQVVVWPGVASQCCWGWENGPVLFNFKHHPTNRIKGLENLSKYCNKVHMNSKVRFAWWLVLVLVLVFWTEIHITVSSFSRRCYLPAAVCVKEPFCRRWKSRFWSIISRSQCSPSTRDWMGFSIQTPARLFAAFARNR